MSDRDDIREQLAAIEHERWADWQNYLHGTTYEFDANNQHHYAIPPVLFRKWERQIATPYAELSESEKQSDREQVERYWPLITAYAAQVTRAALIMELEALLKVHPDQRWKVITDELAALKGHQQ